jgi:hypothetical protein
MLLQSTAGDIVLLSQPLEFLEIFICSYPTSLILIVGFQRTRSRFELQPQRIASFAQHSFLGYAPGGEPENHLPRSLVKPPVSKLTLDFRTALMSMTSHTAQKPARGSRAGHQPRPVVVALALGPLSPSLFRTTAMPHFAIKMLVETFSRLCPPSQSLQPFGTFSLVGRTHGTIRTSGR